MSTVSEAHIAELTRQRDALLRKVRLLSEIAQSIPGALGNARLDGHFGQPTYFDYDKLNRAINAPES